MKRNIKEAERLFFCSEFIIDEEKALAQFRNLLSLI